MISHAGGSTDSGDGRNVAGGIEFSTPCVSPSIRRRRTMRGITNVACLLRIRSGRRRQSKVSILTRCPRRLPHFLGRQVVKLTRATESVDSLLITPGRSLMVRKRELPTHRPSPPVQAARLSSMPNPLQLRERAHLPFINVS